MMKKIFLIIAIAAFTCNAANAQLSNVLSKVASAASSASKGNSTLSSVANVITSKLVPTSSQIVGTWKYQKPAVMFTSDNALKQTAAAVTTSTIENKLQNNYLSKLGFAQGKMSITFNKDKTFTVNRSGKQVASGTYAINGSDVSLTFKGKSTPCKLTPQLDNGTLVLVGDVTKIKSFLESAGAKSGISSLATLTTLSKTMTGAKMGIRMSK